MSPWTLTAIERAFRDAWGADTCMPEIDLTRQQFGADEVVGAGWVVSPPADMRPGRCVEQWELLRRRVFAALGGVPIKATTAPSI